MYFRIFENYRRFLNPRCMEPNSGGLIGTGQLASHEIWLCMRGRWGGWGWEAITEIVWALGLSFAVIAFKIVTLNCPSVRNSLVMPVHCVSAYFYRLSPFAILN